MNHKKQDPQGPKRQTSKIEDVNDGPLAKGAVMGLSPEHYEMLKASAISDLVINERGYKTVVDAKELKRLGFSNSQQRVPGLLLPLHTTDGKTPLSIYRPDHPRILQGKEDSKAKVIKYEMP